MAQRQSMLRNSLKLKFWYKLKQVDHKTYSIFCFWLSPATPVRPCSSKCMCSRQDNNVLHSIQIPNSSTNATRSTYWNGYVSSAAHLVIKAHSVEYLPQVVSGWTWASICKAQDKGERKRHQNNGMGNMQVHLFPSTQEQFWHQRSNGGIPLISGNKKYTYLIFSADKRSLEKYPLYLIFPTN